jgi:hypothetical protein
MRAGSRGDDLAIEEQESYREQGQDSQHRRDFASAGLAAASGAMKK